MKDGHIRSCMQVQCMLHFLQLPIEDVFSGELESASSGLANKQAAHIPFSELSNPIMSQVNELFKLALYCDLFEEIMLKF